VSSHFLPLVNQETQPSAKCEAPLDPTVTVNLPFAKQRMCILKLHSTSFPIQVVPYLTWNKICCRASISNSLPQSVAHLFSCSRIAWEFDAGSIHHHAEGYESFSVVRVVASPSGGCAEVGDGDVHCGQGRRRQKLLRNRPRRAGSQPCGARGFQVLCMPNPNPFLVCCVQEFVRVYVFFCGEFLRL